MRKVVTDPPENAKSTHNKTHELGGGGACL